MIHLHLTDDEAHLVSEGLGRLIAEGEANVNGDHMTVMAKQMLRTHTQNLRVIQARLLVKKAPAPAKRGKGKAAKVDRCSQKPITDLAAAMGTSDTDPEEGFRP
jgi:hypothetical protein